jgi:hypothetical protein
MSSSNGDQPKATIIEYPSWPPIPPRRGCDRPGQHVRTRETMQLTTTIPIVMALVVDPLGSGLVQSLSRPGGNVTGLSMMTSDLNSRRLQLLKDTAPR